MIKISGTWVITPKITILYIYILFFIRQIIYAFEILNRKLKCAIFLNCRKRFVEKENKNFLKNLDDRHISATNKTSTIMHFHHQEHRNVENLIEKSGGGCNSIDDNRQTNKRGTQQKITTQQWCKTASLLKHPR